MYSSTTLYSIVACLPALAAAATTHVVNVGQGGLKFVPETITAASGDTVEFRWATGDHSVTQGDEKNACSPSGASAFNSGDVEEQGSVWSLKINSTDPIYYYCGVGQHCQLGMVGGINVPSIDSYKSAASSASKNVLPQAVQGGTTGGASSGGGSSSSMAPSSSSSPSPSPSSSSGMSTTGTSAAPSSSSPSPTTTPPTSAGAGGAGAGSGNGASANAGQSSSSTRSGSGAAPTEFVGALLAGLPVAVMALL